MDPKNPLWKNAKLNVQFVKQGVAEGDEPDEQYLDKVISDLHKDALGFRPDREFGREWMSSSFEEKLEIYNNLLKSLHSDMDEGIGGMIAGGVGQFVGNKIDPLAGEIMRAHGEIAGRKAEYTIRKYMHLLQKALKQQLNSGGSSNESMQEVSDFGEPREILETVLQTLEREVEWPLTDVMDPREVKQLLAPVVRAVNDKMMSMSQDNNMGESMPNYPLNYERGQQRAMDREKERFKRNELDFELRGEEEYMRQVQQAEAGTWYLRINGKLWRKEGKPVQFRGKDAARKAGRTILVKNPGKKIVLTMKPIDEMTETATAGATSAANVSVGAVYKNKKGRTYKNADGTTKNALDVKGTNLLTGGSIAKR
jgi:hypothetical protein